VFVPVADAVVFPDVFFCINVMRSPSANTPIPLNSHCLFSIIQSIIQFWSSLCRVDLLFRISSIDTIIYLSIVIFSDLFYVRRGRVRNVKLEPVASNHLYKKRAPLLERVFEIRDDSSHSWA
jgi:amino acid transporter